MIKRPVRPGYGDITEWDLENAQKLLEQRRAQEGVKVTRPVAPLPRKKNMSPEESKAELQKRIDAFNQKREIRRREEGYDAPPPGWGMQRPVLNGFICPTCKCEVNKTDTHGQVYELNPATNLHTTKACPTCAPPVQRHQARENNRKLVQRLVNEGTFTNIHNFPDGTEKWTLDTFRAMPNSDKSIATFLKSSFVSGKVKSVILYGPPGRGKTGGAIAAGRELVAQGYTVFHIRASDYIDMIYDDRARLRDKNGLPSQIEKICKGSEVVLFDELGSENAGAMKEIEALIEYRWNVGLRTLVTSNMALEGMQAYYTQDKYEKTGFQPADRIISRLSRYTAKHVGGIDQRRGN